MPVRTTVAGWLQVAVARVVASLVVASLVKALIVPWLVVAVGDSWSSRRGDHRGWWCCSLAQNRLAGRRLLGG